MELKSRKPLVTPSAGNTLAGQAGGDGTAESARSEVGTGGAEAAVNILNAEDDDGDEEAPVPDEFDYESEGEGDE